jgi:hypothetical protein
MSASTTQATQPYLDDRGKAMLQRHIAWWQRGAMLYHVEPDVPMGRLWLPLADGSDAQEDMDLRPEMLDFDRLAGEVQERGPLRWIGDMIATHAPYARVPWVEAILGCPIRATIIGGSMRTRSYISHWEAWESTSHWDQAWYDALIKLTEMLVQRSNGRYAVAHTLMRGPSDLAEAVLGPELMSLSLYDHPQELRRFLDQVTAAFIRVLRGQAACIPAVEGGAVNPFGIWAAGSVVRTQCDASAFLSPRQYAEWFLPYDIRICEAVDYSMIHLHSGSLHTVPALLAVERPHSIQVSIDPEPSGPPVTSMVPIFRQILARKPLVITGPMTPLEAQTLRRELPSGGLYLHASLTP